MLVVDGQKTRDAMRYLVFFTLICFFVLCGWLVAESGLFEAGYPGGRPCILLQQTAVNENSQAGEAPAGLQRTGEDYQQMSAVATFDAYGGPAETVGLGSIDPVSGFKYRLELDSKGAAIRRATFSEFDDRDYKNPQPLVILSPVMLAEGDEILSMANREFVFVQEKLQLPLQDLHFKSLGKVTAEDGSETARFEAVIKTSAGEPVVKVLKTYTVSPGSYLLNCSVAVENLADGELEYRFNMAGPTGLGREGFRSDMRKVVGGFVASEGEIVSSRQEIQDRFLSKKLGLKNATLKYEEAKRSGRQAQIEQAKENLQIGHNLPTRYSSAHFLWVAATNKYFAAILIPVPDEGKNYCDWITDKLGRFYNPDGDSKANSGDETVGLDLRTASNTLAPVGQADSAKTYNFQLYVGPKNKNLFDKNEQYRTLGFVQTIDFMGCCCPSSIISPLAFGILAIMKWMYGFIGNYGVVIVILVFLMRLVMHPLTKRSQVSMSKFQKLANTPEAQQIKKKYANNMAEQQKQMMELYKKYGVSPASQITMMLPMFVQMPIWVALWSAVYASIDLRGAAFLPFWITDLSAPDALVRFSTITLPLLGWKIQSLNLLPILMGVAFFLQQKLMPSQASAAANPQVAQQQKIMMIIFPLMFPVMLYTAPSGVNLYIMASTFAGVFEQYVIRKHIREKEEQEAQGLVAVTSKTGGKVKKKKPKPFYKW
jgi:YidC/Oxa1 family membrane protein insertase